MFVINVLGDKVNSLLLAVFLKSRPCIVVVESEDPIAEDKDDRDDWEQQVGEQAENIKTRSEENYQPLD